MVRKIREMQNVYQHMYRNSQELNENMSWNRGLCFIGAQYDANTTSDKPAYSDNP